MKELEQKLREMIKTDPKFDELVKESFIAHLVGDEGRILSTTIRLQGFLGLYGLIDQVRKG